MKINYGEYCTDRTLDIDEQDYKELGKKKLVWLLSEILRLDEVSIDEIREIFGDLVQLHGEETNSWLCEQCGDYNYEYEWEI